MRVLLPNLTADRNPTLGGLPDYVLVRRSAAHGLFLVVACAAEFLCAARWAMASSMINDVVTIQEMCHRIAVVVPLAAQTYARTVFGA